jgi:hypothetical protein
VKRQFILLAVFGVAGLGVACGDKPPEQPVQRTPEQQRAIDSTVGASALPGAQGVRGALAASDSAARRKAVHDSLAALP